MTDAHCAFACVSTGLRLQFASSPPKEKHLGRDWDIWTLCFCPKSKQWKHSGNLSQHVISWTSRPDTSPCYRLIYRDIPCVSNRVRIRTEWNQINGTLRPEYIRPHSPWTIRIETEREGKRLTWSTLFHWPEISIWVCERWISPVLLLVSYKWQKRWHIVWDLKQKSNSVNKAGFLYEWNHDL